MRGVTAVVGAGMAAAAAAKTLSDAGRRVLVVDKARGPGGRMSTRRANGLSFDHGAQYFTCRSSRFKAQVERAIDAGAVEQWDGRVVSIANTGAEPLPSNTVQRYVGTPGMNAFPAWMLNGVDCRYESEVKSLTHDGQWQVQLADGAVISATELVLTPPPLQTGHLLSTIETPLASKIARVKMTPIWAVLVAFKHPVKTKFDGAFVNDGPLSWVCRNVSKPARGETDTWVLHANARWSKGNLEVSKDQVARALIDAFGQIAQGSQHATYSTAHRWLYAQAESPLACDYLRDKKIGLTIAGSWCAESRVEGAYTSGYRAATNLLDS